MKWLKPVLFAAGLAGWYLTHDVDNVTPTNIKYPLPEEIEVVETRNVPFEDRKGNSSLERIVRIEDIDFSEDFMIKTERYTLVNDKDWLTSRVVGHAFSLLGKLYFWDWNFGLGPDEERAKTALSILENNSEIEGLTVRLGHNKALYDIYRLFTDDKVKERNPFLARATLGVLVGLKDEIWAEFFRGDYYNPMSQTVAIYSNLESVIAHEIGHHEDFQKFDSDWWYALSRANPAIMMQQEWMATDQAMESMSHHDSQQFERILLPAFLTYILFGWGVSKTLVQKRKLKANGIEEKLSEIKESEKPVSYFPETFRVFTNLNVSLFAGMESYRAVIDSGNSEFMAGTAFLGGLGLTYLATRKFFDVLLPLEYD